MPSPLALIAVALAAGSSPPPGDTPGLPRVTLSQALAYARAHQPSLKAARARVAEAEERARLPRAAFLPRIGVAAQLLAGTANNTTASYASTSVLDIVRVGGTPANGAQTWVPSPSTFAGLGVRQEVFDFGRIAAQSAAADFLTQAEQGREELDRLDSDLLVELSYFGVQGARSVFRASEAAFQRAQAHRALAAAGVSSGLRSPIELTRADADVARFDVGRIRAQGGLTIAQTLLAAAIGSPDPAVDAADDDVSPPPPPPLEAVLRQLDTRDPAVREAQARAQAQQEQSRALDAELRPDLALSAGINARAGGAEIPGRPTPTGGGFLPDVPNWDVALLLSWPLFDPVLSTRASVSRQEEAVRRAVVDEVKERARVAVEQAYVEQQEALAALPALERSLEAARANQAQAEARFRAGLGTSTELADAEALLTDAEIQSAIGKFEQSRTRARLGRAISEAAP